MFVNGAPENLNLNNVVYLQNASAEIAKESFYYEQLRKLKLQKKIARENLRIRQTITAAFCGLMIAAIVITLIIVISLGS